MGTPYLINLFILIVLLNPVYSDVDGLADEDNPPGLEEYLKKMDQKKSHKSGFHIYSDDAKKALRSDSGDDFIEIVQRKKQPRNREDILRDQRETKKVKIRSEKFRKKRVEMMDDLFKKKFDREIHEERARKLHQKTRAPSDDFLRDKENDSLGNSSGTHNFDNYNPGQPETPRRSVTAKKGRGKSVDDVSEDPNKDPPIVLKKFKPKEHPRKTDLELVQGLEFPLGTDPFLSQLDKDNALKNDDVSRARVKLGESLFNDKNLSVDRKVSCASCHVPDLAFTDGKRFPVGVERRLAGGLNTPSINNVIFRKRFFWDGRAEGLEEMSLMPFMNPREMGMKDKAEIVSRVKDDRVRYGQMFEDAFDGEINSKTISQAIASFQRVQIIGDSKVDRFLNGDVKSLNDNEKHGLEVFMTKGKCVACHKLEHDFAGPVDSDHRVNTGLFSDVEENKKFIIPTLRNVSKTGPYFHDGRIDSLEEVVELYNKGAVVKSDSVSSMTSGPLNLTKEEKDDLVEFLRALESHPIKQKKIN
ncbi:MAG: c-type cytochrome [Bacteriovoracaceae bacterium]|nr:c-type cytochrome [Bacteriovoracaceae bacterium]